MDALTMFGEFGTAQRLRERSLEFADPRREIRRLDVEGSPMDPREQAIDPRYPAPSSIAAGELGAHCGPRSTPVARTEHVDDFAYLQVADAHPVSIGQSGKKTERVGGVGRELFLNR